MGIHLIFSNFRPERFYLYSNLKAVSTEDTILEMCQDAVDQHSALFLSVNSPKPVDKKTPTPPPRSPKSSGGGFFNFFGGSKKPDTEVEKDEVEEEVKPSEKEEQKPKGL